MAGIKAYKVTIDLGLEDGQGTLDKFGVSTKTKVDNDLKRLVQRHIKSLKNIKENDLVEDFSLDEGEKPGLIIISIATEHMDEPEVQELIAETLRVPVLMVNIENDETRMCVGCDEFISAKDIKRYGEYEDNEGKAVCYSCYESDITEPCATVFYSDDPDEPCTIGYYHNNTEGDFQVKYHRTDGWRGYYDIIPSDAWELAHSDCILAGSDDAEELKHFDEYLREIFEDRNIRWARVISRTSNVFSQGYDFFVTKGKMEEVELIVENLKVACRDPFKFQMTALTGKDPKNCTKEDEVLVYVYNYIKTKVGDKGVQN
jgi:hypothetical protein